jgi:hypothetical protein
VIEHWLRDLEAKLGEQSDFPTPRSVLDNLKQNTDYIGELEIKSKDGIREQLFCYDAKQREGWIIEKANKGLGTITSLGNISREEFVKKYYEPNTPEYKSHEIKRKIKKYSLIALPLLGIGTAMFYMKKLFEHKHEE